MFFPLGKSAFLRCKKPLFIFSLLLTQFAFLDAQAALGPAPDMNSIERKDPTSSQTNADSLTWTVNFSASVQNIDSTDFTLTGNPALTSTGSGTLTVGGTAESGDVYTVTINGVNVNYTVQGGDNTAAIVAGIVKAINNTAAAGVTGNAGVAATVTATSTSGTTISVTPKAGQILHSLSSSTSDANNTQVSRVTWYYTSDGTDGGVYTKPSAGDVVRITINGNHVDYTVQAGDIVNAGGNQARDTNHNIGAGIRDAINADGTVNTIVTASNFSSSSTIALGDPNQTAITVTADSPATSFTIAGAFTGATPSNFSTVGSQVSPSVNDQTLTTSFTAGSGLSFAVSSATGSSVDVTVSGSELVDYEGTLTLGVVGTRNIAAVGTNPLNTAVTGNNETYTLVQFVPTAPGAPSITSIEAGDSKLTVNFNAPSNTGGMAINKFTASCQSSSTDTMEASTTNHGSISLSGLTNGTSYSCTMTATNDVGTSGQSSSISATPMSPATKPDAPTLVSVTAGNGTATLVYTEPSNNGGSVITGYTGSCQQSVSSKSGTSLSATSSTFAPITVTGLVNEQTYLCSLTAKNEIGVSQVSNQISVTPTSGSDKEIEPVVDLSQNDIITDINNTSAIVGQTDPFSLTQDSSNNVVTTIGDSDYTLRPVSVTQSVPDAKPGITITDDGLIQLVTNNQSQLTLLPEPADLQSLISDLTNLGFELKQESFGMMRIALTTNAKQSSTFWFASRAALDSQPATSSSQVGIVASDAEQPANTTVYDYYFLKDNTLYRQRLYSTPADWDSLKAHLASLGQVSINTEGVITLTTSDMEYQALMDYQVESTGQSQDDLLLEMIDDVNSDGLTDYRVTYPNGDKQIMYLLKITKQ